MYTCSTKIALKYKNPCLCPKKQTLKKAVMSFFIHSHNYGRDRESILLVWLFLN